MPASAAMFALTASQRAIWTGQRLQPDEPLYNMALAFRIHGELDPQVFSAAFSDLVLASDSLRLTFTTIDGEPMQEVGDEIPAPLALLDFRGTDAPDISADAWMKAAACALLDTSLCLYDSALIRIGSDDFVWYLNQHHLITDASSSAVLFRQVAQRYEALRNDSPEGPPAMPSFRNHAEREFAAKESVLRVKARDFWNTAGAKSARIERFYQPVPRDLEGQTLRHRALLSAQRRQKLAALVNDRFAGLSSEFSRFQLLATVIAALLMRVSDKSEITIGVPVHNRTSKRLKTLVGLLIEVFPMRLRTSSDDTFATLFDQVREQSSALLMHAPGGGCENATARDIQVVLNYITASFGTFAGLSTEVTWIHPDCADRGHLVRLQIHDFGETDETELHFDLNNGAFPGNDSQRFQQHFFRLLDALLLNPDQQISAVALGDQGVDHWPVIQSPESIPQATVVDDFEQQAAKFPEKVALIDGADTISFGELEARASAIAHFIDGSEAPRDLPVALMLQRSVSCIATILGVLKTGRCYVPIDPDYPPERQLLVIEDCQASMAFCDYDIAPVIAGVRFVDPQSILTTPGARFRSLANADDRAYIIYTSGSTGKPKGVVVQHAQLLHYISWAGKNYLRDRDMVFALYSSLAFDLTITSIFVPLTTGSAIALYRDDEASRQILIRRVVEDQVADIVKLTPTHLSLLQAMDLSESSIKTLILGGEDLKVSLARSIYDYFDGKVEVFNEYGPTEATVGCMIHRFDPLRDTAISVPIGRPIDAARIYLLDDGAHPVPDGIAGQIYIGGAGVSAGYWQRDDLSAERFVVDPFTPGARMYASGDVGRWNQQGEVEYLGRADDQVKIRGVRIEPGEIEAAIRDITGISNCKVVARSRELTDNFGAPEEYCVRCGIDARHPHARLDDNRVCAVCHQFERREEAARAYFKPISELENIVSAIRASATGEYDSMMLLSGGKDSTYALCRIVDLGLKPLVFTLDNGFISDGAKRNMRQVVEKLGLRLVVGETPAMNDIFVDSLRRFSNVCDGCFKTIYTLSTNLALKHGIRHVFTGLSRGQIFQTRVADLFRQNVFDPATIDQMIVDARKTYHRIDDTVARSLDVSAFASDEVFEDIKFVDFYRYSDVELAEVFDYLESRVPWVRPADTGRSTNCLINEAGIYVHKHQRGHHNYSLPYSWDVRLGHKERDSARAELDDNINEQNVRRILGEIGYSGDLLESSTDTFLAAYLVTDQSLDEAGIRDRLAARLPVQLVPQYFFAIDALPLTVNGKLDEKALPDPTSMAGSRQLAYQAPEGKMEQVLARIWSEVLGIKKIGGLDNFFDLGGDSILNIQIVTRARRFNIEIAPQQIFDAPTVSELALVAKSNTNEHAPQGQITGVGLPAPAQQRFLQANLKPSSLYCQTAVIELPADCDSLLVSQAVETLLRHHDGLRTKFVQLDGLWQQRLDSSINFNLVEYEVTDLGFEARQQQLRAWLVELAATTDPAKGINVCAALVSSPADATRQLLVAIHHLVVDGVSWWLLLEDLEQALADLIAGHAPYLPPKSSPFLDWTKQMAAVGTKPATQEFWRDQRLLAPVTSSAMPDLEPRSIASVSLPRGQTLPLLRTVPGRLRTKVPDIILATLLGPIAGLLDGEVLQIDVEAHGREDTIDNIDILRTVGWFTSIFPVIIPIKDLDEVTSIERVRRISDLMRAVPNHGQDFGVIRYLDPATQGENSDPGWPASPILFNYLGQWNSSPAGGTTVRFAEPIGLVCGSGIGPRYALEFDAVVFDGQLRLRCDYAEQYFSAADIEQVLIAAKAALLALPDADFNAANQVLTPDDFPEAELSQSDLDSVLADFSD